MTPPQPFNILFLCTGNSARSILAEAIVNEIGAGRFASFSAGSFPKGAVHPQALALLERLGHPTGNLRSKSWDEFAAPGAPELDFIITVCDNAAGEVCPIWPGHPITAHWGLPDPAAAKGTDAEVALAFADTYRMLTNRLKAFTSLPVESLSKASMKAHMDEIGANADTVSAE
jgi:protein-tyrosine-phosphatase